MVISLSVSYFEKYSQFVLMYVEFHLISLSKHDVLLMLKL
jgi:hypothetical protein